MYTIYVLSCKDGKYYIGKTYRPLQDRICEHFINEGSAWTKKYTPILVVQIISTNDSMDEDKYTKIYMKKYGVENVRGGSYSSLFLPPYKLQALRDELNTSKNTCFRCYKQGHFIKDCKETKYVDGSLIDNNYFKKASYTICSRCGRKGHNHFECYACTHIQGHYLEK